jgi:hypothetical protein
MAKPWWKQISEDWWSVIIGLTLVGFAAAGIISNVPW